MKLILHVLFPLLALPLAGCVASPPADPAPAVTAQYEIEVQRAYKLEDPREDDFKTRIADQANSLCGSKRHHVVASRPIGFESYGDEFITRSYIVGIACQA